MVWKWKSNIDNITRTIQIFKLSFRISNKYQRWQKKLTDIATFGKSKVKTPSIRLLFDSVKILARTNRLCVPLTIVADNDSSLSYCCTNMVSMLRRKKR